jgi:Secretion system C-terminal sorting domain
MRIIFNYILGFSLLLVLSHCSFAQGIYNSANIVVSGSASIAVQDGGFYNTGTFIPATGSVNIGGTAVTGISSIGGNGLTTFYNLTINKTSNDVVLANNISVDGNLLMQSGNLLLNLFTIDLGNGAGTIINEHNNARITGTTGGYILKRASLNAPSSVNPGNIGIAISSAANLGSTLIKRGHEQQTISTGVLSIYRYYDIIPTNNASLGAGLQLYYEDNELGGIDKTSLNFYKSTDNGTTYTLIGKDNSDPSSDWVLKNNIDQLSRFTLASTSSSLPVKLASFTANLINRQTNLQWITSQEINSSYFDVQRSADGVAFNKLLAIPAKGNSAVQNKYVALDANPLNGINYYRLKEVDKDGNSQLSPIVYVMLTESVSWSMYPNPASEICLVQINVPTSQRLTIGLYDVTGKLLEQKTEVPLVAGNNQLQWNLSHFAGGIYFLRSNNLGLSVIRVIKK